MTTFEISESAKRWFVRSCLVHGMTIDDAMNYNTSKDHAIITKNQLLKFFDRVINDYFERQKWMPKDANDSVKYPDWFFKRHIVPNGEKPHYGIERFSEPSLNDVQHEAINLSCLKKSPQINRDDFSTRLSLKLLSQKFST